MEKKEKLYQFLVKVDGEFSQYLWAGETQLRKAINQLIPGGSSYLSQNYYPQMFRKGSENIGLAASSDNLGSLEISVREPKNAVEIIRQLNLPYPDEKFWKTADYQVILISSQGKHYEVRKRVRVSKQLLSI